MSKIRGEIKTNKKSLNKESSVKYQVDDLLSVAYKFGESNPLTTVKSVDIALKKAIEINYTNGILLALFCRIRANASSGNFTTCIEDYNTIISIEDYETSLNKKDLAEVLRIIAFAFSLNGELELSIDCGKESLILFIELNNTLGIAKANNLLGAISFIANDYGNGYIYYTNCIDYLKGIEDKNVKEIEELAIAYSNLGYLYTRFEDYEQAEEKSKLAISLIQTTDNVRLQSIFLHILSTAYMHNNQQVKSLDILAEAILICSVEKHPGTYIEILNTKALNLYLLERYNDAYDICVECIMMCNKNEIFINNYWSAQCTLCACLIKQKYYKEALHVYNSFKDRKQDANEIQLEHLFETLVIAYEHLEDYKNAFTIAKEFIDFKDGFAENRRKSRLQKLEVEYKIRDAENELAAQKKILDKELEFNNLLQKEYNNQRDFLNFLAHDLKAPIRTIKSFSGIALKNLEGKQEDTNFENIKFIAEGINNMENFVEDLLSFARSGEIDKEPKPIDLNIILDKVKNSLANDLSSKNAKVSNETLPTILANETPLIQLFQNIIGNGIKYSRVNVDPEILVSKTETDEVVTIAIKDNGQGIPKKLLNEVFKPFIRNHADNKVKGHGLGLASCKKIVESYNGTISVESEVGVGSTFYFTFKKLNNTT